ncbi:MAG: response regulator [Spirochaetaceae bacterium]|nr:response regulator [Spirochaetaceae bacterium]MCF7946980.1 response regulator [Spirochaetia bacterium]MCF7950187.1 response regulator [Spirochaetaceae bacterium]
MEEKTKILIVDDEPVNLDFFQLMLGKLGFEVLTSEDGEDALEKVTEYNPDLIILDNVMPKLSGWQVTRLLKSDQTYSDYRNIPIIMFSAMDDVKDKVEGFELGVEDYITKPFNFSEVLARIRAVLRSRRMSARMELKQRRIDVAEKISTTFLDFLNNLKEPIAQVEAKANEVSTDKKGVSEKEEFIKFVKEQVSEVRSSIEKLEQDIDELKLKEVNARDDEQALRELDSKLQEHFVQLQEHEDSMKEVKG